MARLGQAYIHLRPYELDAETIQRLGRLVQASAEEAVRRFYRGGVTVEIDIQEGSGKFWASVVGGFTLLHVVYGVIADYKGFKDGIAEIVHDTRAFGDFMIDAVTHGAQASDGQIFRTERRLHLPFPQSIHRSLQH